MAEFPKNNGNLPLHSCYIYICSVIFWEFFRYFNIFPLLDNAKFIKITVICRYISCYIPVNFAVINFFCYILGILPLFSRYIRELGLTEDCRYITRYINMLPTIPWNENNKISATNHIGANTPIAKDMIQSWEWYDTSINDQ